MNKDANKSKPMAHYVKQAQEVREQCNQLTDEQRRTYTDRALAYIYGGRDRVTAQNRR